MRGLLGDARWHEATALLAMLGDLWAHVLLASLISVLVGMALARIWPGRSPELVSRLAFLSVVLPVVAAPLYTPALDGLDGVRPTLALFRADGWLYLVSGSYAWVVWGVIPLALLVVLPFAAQGTAILLSPRRYGWEPARDGDVLMRVAAAGQAVGAVVGFTPRLVVVQRAEPLAWASGLFRPAILLSEGLVHLLDQEELEAVIAHECAHIVRRDMWIDYLSFVARAALLFNPAVTWASWQTAAQAERSCDRWVARRTDRRLALGAALIKIDRAANGRASDLSAGTEDIPLSVRLWEGHARKTLLRERVERLLQDSPAEKGDAVWPATMAMVGLVFLALFFVG